MLDILRRLLVNPRTIRSNPYTQLSKMLSVEVKLGDENFSRSGFGLRLFLHFRVSHQNINDVRITWPRYSGQRHRGAFPPSSAKCESKGKKHKPLALKKQTFYGFINILGECVYSLWECGALGMCCGDVPAEWWAVRAVDWWLDLRCGSRRGERMTHSVWCDVHPATARQCGGTPVLQPLIALCSQIKVKLWCEL